MEEAKMRLELAQSELGMRQQAGGMKMFRDLLGGAPVSGAPAAPGAAAQAAPGAPAGQPRVQQDPNAPSGFSNVTPQAIAMLAAIPGMESKAKILADLLKGEQDRYAISMNGIVFDKRTGKYMEIPIPGQKQEDFETPYGMYKLTPNEYAQLMNAHKEGKGKEWIAANLGGRRTVPELKAAESLEQKPYVTPYGTFDMTPSQYLEYQKAEKAGGESAGRAYLERLFKRTFKPATGALSASERAAQKAGAETMATGEAKSVSERSQEIVKRGAASLTRLAQLGTLKSIASRPDANQIFGVFEGNDIASAALRLMEGSNMSGASAIRDVFTNLGLDKTLKADQLAAAQLLAQINLDMRQMTRTPGEGAVSDFETRMILAAGLDRADTPAGMMKKIQFLEEKYKFEKQVSSAFKRAKSQNVSLDDFIESSEYEKLANNYFANLQRIVGVEVPSTLPGTGGSSSRYSGAAEKLRQAIQ